MPRVLVTPPLLRNDNGPCFQTLLKAGFEVVYPPSDCDTYQQANLLRLLAGVDGMVASTELMPRELLEQTRLRAIARVGVGYDSIDIPAATELGIVVTITPGTLEESVAEHTVALMLAVTRDLLRKDREVRSGVWLRKPFPRMAGRTFGIVGLGRIGKSVVPKVQGLGMKIIACDPFPDTAFVHKHGIKLVPLDELLATADVVSVHSPSTGDTCNLINAETLGMMKRGAVLLNTSRGALVDEEAVCAALNSGHLLGAALDVFKKEPLPLTSPLLRCENLLLCSHMGGLDSESTAAASCLAAQCLADLYQGKWPEVCVVNQPVQAGWKW